MAHGRENALNSALNSITCTGTWMTLHARPASDWSEIRVNQDESEGLKNGTDPQTGHRCSETRPTHFKLRGNLGNLGDFALL